MRTKNDFEGAFFAKLENCRKECLELLTHYYDATFNIIYKHPDKVNQVN